jgi:hypothetical protein
LRLPTEYNCGVTEKSSRLQKSLATPRLPQIDDQVASLPRQRGLGLGRIVQLSVVTAGARRARSSSVAWDRLFADRLGRRREPEDLE